MDIPDEAWKAFSVPVESFSWKYTNRYTHHSGLEAAAPIIARAAQVAILRQMAAEIDGKHAIDAADLRAKADELERGEWCTCEPLWTGEAPAVPDRHCPVHREGT